MKVKKPPLLDIRNLFVKLPAGAERSHAAEDLNFTLEENEILCVVGESGSGKSITALAVMGLLPAPHVRVESGDILFNGENLTRASAERLRKVRGGEISMIFQDPMTALNPVLTVGKHIDEVIRIHATLQRGQRRDRALQLIGDVQLPNPDRIINSYPHELSGGQRQRAMIAMALAMEPKILIADEPTTALDVTTQAQILQLIKHLQKSHNTGVLFITHDFGVVADIADRVVVMQHGRMVEINAANEVLNNPRHAYTKSLIRSVPGLTPRKARPISGRQELKVSNLTKIYRSGGGLLGFSGREHVLHATDSVCLTLHHGETLGVVGESGSGKSTLARCIVRLINADAGQILYQGTDLRPLNRAAMRPYRAKIQMVFQDPYASLNPRKKVGHIIADGPVSLGATQLDAEKKAREMLELVGLDVRAFERYPHEFSGGQRQRIGIARALTLEPEILVADEPVSALDVSIQAQILRLLADIRDRLQLSMIFITHDLRVASQVCDRIAVMRLGKVEEEGATADLFANATHPYTRELLDAVPGRDWRPPEQ